MIFGFFKTLPDIGLKQGDIVEIERREDEKRCFYFGKITRFEKKRSFCVELYASLPPGTAPGEEVVLTVIHDAIIKTWKSKIVSIGSNTEPQLNVVKSSKPVLTFYLPKEAEYIDTPAGHDGLIVSTSSTLVNVIANFRAMQSAHNQTGIIQEIRKDGFTMLTNLSIPGGTQLSIGLELPYEKEIFIKGRVVKGEPKIDLKKHLISVDFDPKEIGAVKDLMQFALFCFRRTDKYNRGVGKS